MAKNEFFQAISIDVAPNSSTCEWCSRPAEERLMALGGTYHNKGGFFCRDCGEEFTRLILNSLSRKTAPTFDAWRNAAGEEVVIGLD